MVEKNRILNAFIQIDCIQTHFSILKKLPLALLLSVLLLSCGSDEDKEPFGFPIAPGNTWEFSIVWNTSDTAIMIDSIGGEKSIGDFVYHRMHRRLIGQAPTELTDESWKYRFIRSVPDTAFYFLEWDSRDSTTINELVFEITDIDGHEYQFPININGVSKTALMYVEQANIRIEEENYAGFLYTRTTQDTDDGTHRMYFVPEIGFSRLTHNPSSGAYRYELESYQLQ